MIVCALVCALPAPAAAARTRHPTKAAKALARALAKQPRLALKPGFLHKAAAADMDLPLTVRLSRRTDSAGGRQAADDTLHLRFDPFTDPVLYGAQPPVDPPGGYDARTTLTLDGSYSMVAHFGADTSGYGRPWVVEVTQGQRVQMTSSSVSALLVDADPATAPDCATPVLQTTTAWSFATGGATYGTLDLLGGNYTGSLRLAPTVSAAQPAACGGPHTWTTAAGAPALPFALSGRFHLTPAITADGKVRLGTIAVTDGGAADNGTHAELHLHCADCSPAADLTLAGRAKALSFTAEILLGDVT